MLDRHPPRFVDPHTVDRSTGDDAPDGHGGTRSSSPPAPRRPGRRTSSSTTGAIVDSDGILQLETIPGSMVVVGAGVIGIEYASMFAALGTKVTVVDQRSDMLPFCDNEIVESLQFHLRDLAVTFRFGETVESVQMTDYGHGHLARRAASGSRPRRSCTPPAGRARPTTLEPAGRRARRRQARPDRGRRGLPHQQSRTSTRSAT